MEKRIYLDQKKKRLEDLESNKERMGRIEQHLQTQRSEMQEQLKTLTNKKFDTLLNLHYFMNNQKKIQTIREQSQKVQNFTKELIELQKKLESDPSLIEEFFSFEE